ncbi:MAG: hypothetical protein PHI98_05150 [Eubacteriales bacterium]|nr:hypothetical protein [Eubacteriales bacterium]
MKKLTTLLLAFATGLQLCSFASAESAVPVTTQSVALPLGSVTVYDFGSAKLHAYHTMDALADQCYLVEGKDGLVMIEASAFTANLIEWNGYIQGLGKPVVGALLSYHPNGMENFGNVTVYTTKSALASWGEGGSVRGLTDSFVQGFGEVIATSMPDTAEIVNYGDTVTLAGMDFVIRNEGDEGFGVEIPAINCAYLHMMGSDCHNILTGEAHIKAFIEELKGFRYTLVLTSHYAPEGEDAVQIKIAYLEKTLELARSCSDAESFIAAMNEAFPDYEGSNYLQMTAGFLYQ